MVDRGTIFGAEADAYDRLRPRYPVAVIDMIVAGSPDVVVDAGCGTGIAARQVSDRGVRVLGVEPDAKMAAIARSFGIEVVVSRLEEWDAMPCDVLYAAQAWHWIDPRLGARVAAAAIRPGGLWLVCWNLEMDEAIGDVCDVVYREHAPELLTDRAAMYVSDERFEQTIAGGLDDTGDFEPVTRQIVRWIDRIDSEHFVDRLDSHSAHRMLDDERRRRVRGALLDALGRGATLQVEYATDVFSARHS
jgi:SAM-dependent methyltransferase